MDSQIVIQLGVALGLGLLVGLQREWSSARGVGIRTFALITVFGTVCAQLSNQYGGWVLAAGLIALAVLMVMALTRLRTDDGDPGMTTEVAALMMYGVGAWIVVGPMSAAVITAGAVAVLLQWKKPLHSFVKDFDETDIRAIFQFVLIALVILPLLPDKNYGPYEVLNPFKIWLMVVLIVGISIGAFIAQKALKSQTGSLLGGVLGGLISSTATTVSYARQSRHDARSSALAALVVMIASTVVFGRVLAEIALVAPEILKTVFPPIAAMSAFMLLIVFIQSLLLRRTEAQPPIEHVPSGLKPAIVFGLLYAVVVLAIAAGKQHWGDQGLYFIAAASGMTDMDAITLSTAELIKTGDLNADIGFRMILIGFLSNLIFKAGVVAVLANRRLLSYVLVLFSLCFAAGVAIVLFWPDVTTS